MKLTTKLVGDAGEYFALSRFILDGGMPAAKMPDNWENYDLVVDHNGKLKKISVKTRTTEKSSFATEHCKFDAGAAKDIDFLVFIFKTSKGEPESWVIPYKVAEKKGVTLKSKEKGYRRLSHKQLTDDKLLKKYSNNWSLKA